jgi:hypothetical protein
MSPAVVGSTGSILEILSKGFNLRVKTGILSLRKVEFWRGFN